MILINAAKSVEILTLITADMKHDTHYVSADEGNMITTTLILITGNMETVILTTVAGNVKTMTLIIAGGNVETMTVRAAGNTETNYTHFCCWEHGNPDSKAAGFMETVTVLLQGTWGQWHSLPLQGT